MLIIVIGEKENQDILVDNLIEWYNRKKEKITYPKDARMHEARDKIPQGMFFAENFISFPVIGCKNIVS